MAVVITNITKGRGRTGDSITIDGTGFSASNNAVTVDTLAASITVQSTTQITATVTGSITLDRHVEVKVTNQDNSEFDTRDWWSKDSIVNLETVSLPAQLPSEDENKAAEDPFGAEAKDPERIVTLIEGLRDDILPRPGTGVFPITDAGASKIGTLASAYQNITPATNDVQATLEALDGGLGALVLVEKKTITVNSSSITFSGLDGDTDEIYALYYRFRDTSGTGVFYRLRPNGLATNLTARTFISRAATAAESFENTDGNFAQHRSGAADHLWGKLIFYARKSVGGQAMDRTWHNAFGVDFPTSFDVGLNIGTWAETATNLTSLGIVTSPSAGMAPGSTIALYKIKQS